MTNQFTALAVAGPSGVGKSTLIRAGLEAHPRWTFSISATTRPRRDHEQEGVDYFFLPKEEFLRRVNSGEFVEYANVYGNFYGTLRSEFDRAAAEDKGLLIEVDTVGCLSIKALRPKLPIVAVVPPSMVALRERLMARGTETDEELELRLANEWLEMARMRTFDFVVINDDLDKACSRFSDLLTVIEAGTFDVEAIIDRILETSGENK